MNPLVRSQPGEVYRRDDRTNVGMVMRWHGRLVARVMHTPMAMGYPFHWGGQSEREFRDSERGLRRAKKWVDRTLDVGVRP